MAPKPALGAHWFQITVTCVKQRIVGKEKKQGAGKGGVKIVILSTSTSTQIPNHKISKKRKKKNDVSKQHSKQAIRQGSWEKLQNVC